MEKKYIHEGFASLSEGMLGNGGQNLYISQQGVLQRIFNFDTTGNGCFDIMIANSHDYNEKPPLQVIARPATASPDIREILTDGSHAAAVADLNGDGHVDLIVSNHRSYGDHRTETAVWWNGPEGFNEENRIFLPCLGPHDMVGVDVGNIYDRGDEEYYTSPVVEVSEGETVIYIGWEGNVPEKCWVHAQVRAADSAEGLSSLPFTGPDGTEDSFYQNGQPLAGHTGRLIQYRLALGAKSGIGTPRITSIYLVI